MTPSSDPGQRPELLWVDKTLIDVDKRYQREVSRQGIIHVNGILRDFEWRYFQVISVTPNKGRYFAIDGQHRWLAAMRHPLVTEVPCLVLPAMDLRQQAKVFDIMNTKRLGITSLAKHHAAVAAGDPKAMRIDYICSEAGVTVLKTVPQGGALPALSLVSVATLGKFFHYGDALLIAAMSAMAEAWPDRAGGFRAANVAMTIMASADLGPDFSLQRMKNVLRRWNDGEEYLKAYTERSERGGIVERILARRLAEAYRGQ